MSTAVAFHFNAPNKLVYACKLVRKLQRMSMPLVVLGEQVTLDALDKSLWTFGGEAQFLAHHFGYTDRGIAAAFARIVKPVGRNAQRVCAV